MRFKKLKDVYMGVSENSGTPKSSILVGFSIINHPFRGTTIFGNTHILVKKETWIPFLASSRRLTLAEIFPQGQGCRMGFPEKP